VIKRLRSHANAWNCINVTYDHSFDKDLLCIARDIDRKMTVCRHWGSIGHHFDRDYCRKDCLLERIKADHQDITKSYCVDQSPVKKFNF